MKKLNKVILKGTIISLIINVIANYITFNDAQWINVLVGTGLGLIVYLVLENK